MTEPPSSSEDGNAVPVAKGGRKPDDKVERDARGVMPKQSLASFSRASGEPCALKGASTGRRGGRETQLGCALCSYPTKEPFGLLTLNGEPSSLFPIPVIT